jgi:hypothetical protein
VLLALSIIVAATAIIEGLIFLRIYRFPFVQVSFLGVTHSLTHWMGWGGALYIAFSSPIQPLVKRKAPRHLRTGLSIHMIGNSLAFLLVSIHFAQQLTRPPSSYPDLGTGIALYAATTLLVATGILLYSGMTKKFVKPLHFLHPAFALAFYLIVIVHILHGLSVI